MLLRRLKNKPIRKSLFPSTIRFKNNNTQIDPEKLAILDKAYAKLQASKSKSLLKKHLTPGIFKELRTKTTKHSSTLLDCIQSGLKNPDSNCGIYAPDPEAYKVFAPLFDPIIEDYHGGFKKEDKHPGPNFGNPCVFGNPDPFNNYIASTRIRVARSLQGFAFNPVMTKADYDVIEDKIHCTLSGFRDDLKGVLHPLIGMKKSVQSKLINDHFLFRPGDRFLRSANAYRYWPTGRSIYYNFDKTFLVWCNEEDHMRVISMQRGGHIGDVFSRLMRGLKAIELKIKFAHDDRLGYLSFCPTNLGTSMRASVHIRIPKLASDKGRLEEIAKKYKLQIRGTHGEHTEAEAGIYDISNRRRLGLTEYQIVRGFCRAIVNIIDLEKQAAAKSGAKKSAKADKEVKVEKGKPVEKVKQAAKGKISCK